MANLELLIVKTSDVAERNKCMVVSGGRLDWKLVFSVSCCTNCYS